MLCFPVLGKQLVLKDWLKITESGFAKIFVINDLNSPGRPSGLTAAMHESMIAS